MKSEETYHAASHQDADPPGNAGWDVQESGRSVNSSDISLQDQRGSVSVVRAAASCNLKVNVKFKWAWIWVSLLTVFSKPKLPLKFKIRSHVGLPVWKWSSMSDLKKDNLEIQEGEDIILTFCTVLRTPRHLFCNTQINQTADRRREKFLETFLHQG